MASLTIDQRDELSDGSITAEAPPQPANDPSIGHSVARGALSLLSTQPLTWGATLLGIVADPRLLSAAALGQITVAVTICNIASMATNLGISDYLVRRIAQRPATLRRDVGIALTVQMFTACLGVLVVSVLGRLFWTSIVDYPLLLVAQIPMLVAPARTVLLSAFRGREQHQRYAWLNAACLVSATLSGFFVLLWGGSLFLATATCGVALIVTTAVAWKLSDIRPSFASFDRSVLAEFSQFIRAGLPFLGWGLTQLAYSQIDRLIMGALVSVAQVGWYASANRIIAIPIFIPTMIITPLFPALSRSIHSPNALRRSLAETLRLVLLLTVPLSAGTIAIAPAIPSLLGWPADFENTVLPMRILALQLPLVSFGMVLGTVIMAIGREKRFVLVAVTATVFNIATNVIAIPLFDSLMGNGGIGASLITVASEVLMLFGALILIPKHLRDPRTAWAALRIAIAGCATAIVGMALLPVALIACIAGGAVTYVAAAFLLRVLSIEDLRILKSRLSRGH